MQGTSPVPRQWSWRSFGDSTLGAYKYESEENGINRSLGHF